MIKLGLLLTLIRIERQSCCLREEGLDNLKTVTFKVNSDADAGAINRRGLEGIFSSVIFTGRELLTGGVRELEWLAVRSNKRVS